MTEARIAVIGAGYAGLTAALALGTNGRNVAVVGHLERGAGQRDTRSTALFPASIKLLKTLGVWESCAPASRPLRGIRLIDETQSWLRAPEVTFRADDVGLEALAINVPNSVLYESLLCKVLETPNIEAIGGGNLTGVSHTSDHAELILESGRRYTADWLIGADGRESVVRHGAGIDARVWNYEQTAIATAFRHTAPHDDISTEFHRPAGPLTTVPGPKAEGTYTSHLVWIERPDRAENFAARSDDDFTDLLEHELQGLLGAIAWIGPRKCFPIKGQTATTFAKRRSFLIGEAAHVIPPIGAQGLNLGLRDIADLMVVFADSEGQPAAELCKAYDNLRRTDVWVRTSGVDLLNRSLTTSFWPLHAIRGVGLHALNALPALKRATIRAGFGH